MESALPPTYVILEGLLCLVLILESCQTLFNIGSCSKAFLVAALGILMEDFSMERNVTELPSELKRFDWETKVQDVLPPEFPPIFAKPWTSAQATFRDVSSHMSGVGR